MGSAACTLGIRVSTPVAARAAVATVPLANCRRDIFILLDIDNLPPHLLRPDRRGVPQAFPAGAARIGAGSLKIMVLFAPRGLDLLGRWFDEFRRARIARLVSLGGCD